SSIQEASRLTRSVRLTTFRAALSTTHPVVVSTTTTDPANTRRTVEKEGRAPDSSMLQPHAHRLSHSGWEVRKCRAASVDPGGCARRGSAARYPASGHLRRLGCARYARKRRASGAAACARRLGPQASRTVAARP